MSSKPPRAPREPSEKSLREALAQQQKELRTLPASWYDQEVQGRMGLWLKAAKERES